MKQGHIDPLQLAEEASRAFNAQADEAQRELNKLAVELTGASLEAPVREERTPWKQ